MVMIAICPWRLMNRGPIEKKTKNKIRREERKQKTTKQKTPKQEKPKKFTR